LKKSMCARRPRASILSEESFAFAENETMTSARAVTVLRRLCKLAAAPADATSDAELLARFTAGHDQGAFAGLVARHGPMVLGVCRRILRDAHDAEDAFQATFLVLARKAGSICKGESLASWLYGVAYRVAVKARAGAARRRAREQRAVEMSAADPLLDMTVREVQQVLHEELHQLPEKYRAPLVLCYLEGKSQEEAASQLGWSKGTTRGRLDRGRDQLRKRLARRGLALSAVLGAAALGASPVPAALAASVVGAAPLSASGGVAVAVSANASTLAEGVMHAMFASKVKTAAAVLLAAVLLTAGTGWLLRTARAAHEREGPPAAAAPAGEKKTKGPAKEKGAATFAGRVLDPDGRPVRGARVYLTVHDASVKGTPKARAVTGATGRFHFTAPRADKDSKSVTSLFATADGFGPAWVISQAKPWWPWRREIDRTGAFTLRLAKDDVPVSGRILNLEGKPVPGVTVSVTAIKAPPGGSLTPWLEAVKTRPSADGIPLDYQYLPMFFTEELNRLFPTIRTGADGRFTLRGIGRERVVTLVIEGPTIETKEINIMTRPGLPTITIPWYRDDPEAGDLTYYPARFDHAAAPCRLVSGVVRDKVTGKPVAGALVRAERGVGNTGRTIQATTDRGGRYRLTGLGGGRGRRGPDTLVVVPPKGQGYVSAQKRLAGPSRLEPVRLDFELARGVWIEGRVTDRVTGAGVEAQIRYYVFRNDPAAAALRTLHLPDHLYTDKQGRFRFVGVHGRALLGARAWGAKGEHYRVAVGADRIAGKESLPGTTGLRGTYFRTLPHSVFAMNHDVLVEVKPPKGAEKVRCDLKLDPGLTQKVRVLDAGGKPLPGARVAGQLARESFDEPLERAELTVYALTAGEPRILLFQHEGKKLAGRLELKGPERGPVEVKLQPAAAVLGRLIDARGRPLRHADVTVYYKHVADRNMLNNHHPQSVLTDAEGRFRIGGLVPGLYYVARVRLKGKMYPGEAFRDLSLKAGETRDLGDVKPRTRDE
jgi:RNA polymerase sigma factor (sigma-70 family)